MQNFILKHKRLHLHRGFVSKLNNSCQKGYTDLIYILNFRHEKMCFVFIRRSLKLQNHDVYRLEES